MEYLQSKTSMRCPNQVLEQSPLAHFIALEQQLCPSSSPKLWSWAFILAACSHDFILSVASQSSCYDHRCGLECRQAGKIDSCAFRLSFLHHNNLVKCPLYCWYSTDLLVNLTILPSLWDTSALYLEQHHLLLVEHNGLKYDDADSHPGGFKFKCKLPQYQLKVTVICNKLLFMTDNRQHLFRMSLTYWQECRHRSHRGPNDNNPSNPYSYSTVQSSLRDMAVSLFQVHKAHVDWMCEKSPSPWHIWTPPTPVFLLQ